MFADGPLPKVKLPDRRELERPAFYLIHKDHLIWDNGYPNDPATLIQFRLRFGDRQEIRISQSSDFAITLGFQSDGTDSAPTENKTVWGKYAFFGERLRISWEIWSCPCDLSKKQITTKTYSVILERADPDDPATAVNDKAAAAADPRMLQGRWRITHVTGAAAEDAKIGHDFLFEGNGLKILRRDVDDVARPFGPILLNRSANSKQIVFFNDDAGRAQSGIYRIVQDRLQICWRVDDHNEERVPTKFEAGGNSKTVQLIELERVDAAAEQAATDKTRLIDLEKARVDALQSQRKAVYARIEEGKEDPLSIFEALESLKKARLALAEDQITRIQIVKSYLQDLREIDSLKKAEVGDIKITPAEVLRMSVRLLMAEMALEKEIEPADKSRSLDLQKKLVEELQKLVDYFFSAERFESEKDSLSEILQALDNLKDVQLALATEKKARVNALEAFLHRMLIVEARERAEFFGGSGKSRAYQGARIKAHRLLAEILLEEEKEN